MSGDVNAPWRFAPGGPDDLPNYIRDAGGFGVARVLTPVNNEAGAHKRGHLMAAAPEMLEALKAALTELGENEYTEHHPVYRQVRDVIAKAEALS